MNAPLVKAIRPAIGSPFEGGFYAGDFRIGEQQFALIVSPKAEGDHDAIAWNDSYKKVEGALTYNDGLVNTDAMAAAGSKLAKWARGLRIEGHDDWYIPSQDELEIIYRSLKPTNAENYLYARAGINASAIPPTYPYTADLPAQTNAELFQKGGPEALEESWYWTSTQHASSERYAWVQDFGGGGQDYYHKDDGCRARAVRRLPL